MLNIKVNNLKKSYGRKQVLTGLDFEANQGEVIAVIGKNGAGKSTFLETLMMMRDYDAGTVNLFGQELKSLSTKEREQLKGQLSIVLQPTNFYKNLRVIELLELFQSYYGKKIDLKEIIADFELDEHRKTFFDKLSGGWKQRVALAIAFMTKPKLVILDEPTTGLDPHMRDVLWKNIIRYNKQHNGTVLLSTHYMDEVEKYCDKLLLINHGISEVFDTPENIMKQTGFSSINDFYLAQVADSKEAI